MNLTNEKILEALNWRYATKRFDPGRKIPPDDWKALEEVLRLSPSSFGLQPWRFIVVDNPEVRQQLHPATWGQTQVVEASHLVVFAVRRQLDEGHVDSFIDDMATTRGVPRESLASYRAMIVSTLKNPEHHKEWNARQAYLAFGSLMTVAALKGIDVCPIEGLEPADYDRILKLTGTPFTTVAAAAVGYRSNDDKYAKLPKVRFPRERVIQHI